MTLTKVEYFEESDNDPMLYVFEWDAETPLRDVLEREIIDIDLDFSRLIIQQKIEDFISPEVNPDSEITDLISTDMIELLIHQRITDDEMNDILKTLLDEEQEEGSFQDTQTNYGVESTQNTTLQSAMQTSCMVSRFRHLVAKSSHASSVVPSHYQKVREQQKELTREYSWVLDYRASPLYVNKADPAHAQLIQDYLFEKMHQKIILACSVEVELHHPVDWPYIVEYVSSHITGKPLQTASSDIKSIMSVLRNEYGGWCVAFFQITKKSVCLDAVLPICCRHSLTLAAEKADLSMWQYCADEFSQQIHANSSLLADPGVLEGDDVNGKMLNNPVHLLLNIDGLLVSFATGPRQAVLFDQTLNVALREIAGEYDSGNGGTNLFQDILQARMQSLIFVESLEGEFELSRSAALNSAYNTVFNNLERIIGMEEDGNNKAVDLINYIVKIACQDARGIQELYPKVLNQLQVAIESANCTRAGKILCVLEQFILYPRQPASEQSLVDTKLFESINSETVHSSALQSDIKTHINNVYQAFVLLRHEQLVRQNLEPERKNPPAELLIEEQAEVEMIMDCDAVQYNTVNIIFVQLDAQNNIKLRDGSIEIYEVFPTEDLDSYHLESQHITDLLTIMPYLCRSKVEIANLSSELSKIVRKLRKITDDGEFEVEYCLERPIVFNRRNFNGVYNHSTVAFYAFTRSAKPGTLPLLSHQEFMLNTYGRIVSTNQDYLSGISHELLSNVMETHDFSDKGKQFYFLIAMRQNCDEEYGIEFLIDSQTRFLYFVESEENLSLNQLFCDIRAIESDSKTLRDLSNQYSNMHFVLATMVEDSISEGAGYEFMNFLQISLKFMAEYDAPLFHDMVDKYIKSLGTMELHKLSIEDPENDAEPPKDEFDDEEFAKAIKMHTDNFKAREDVQSYKLQTRFNEFLVRNSPFTQVLLQDYVFNESELEEDELLLFQDQRLQNYLFGDRMIEVANYDYVPELECSACEEINEFQQESFFDLVIPENILPNEEELNEKVELTERERQEFDSDYEQITSVLMQMLDGGDQAEVDGMKNNQQYLRELEEEIEVAQEGLLVDMKKPEVSARYIDIYEAQQQLEEYERREINQKMSYEKAICDTCDDYLNLMQFLSELEHGIRAAMAIEAAVVAEKQELIDSKLAEIKQEREWQRRVQRERELHQQYRDKTEPAQQAAPDDNADLKKIIREINEAELRRLEEKERAEAQKTAASKK